MAHHVLRGAVASARAAIRRCRCQQQRQQPHHVTKQGVIDVTAIMATKALKLSPHGRRWLVAYASRN